MNKIKILSSAIKRVLKEKKYFLIFMIFTFAFLALFVSIPVFAIPGNDLNYQLSVFTFTNYLTMFVFSGLTGLMISMQVYNYKLRKSAKNISGGIFGSFAGFTAGIFGTASCASCVVAIFGFLGAGTVFFLIEQQWYVMVIALGFLLLSIYLTSLGIEKGCEKCR